jgi:hypothetical protein
MATNDEGTNERWRKFLVPGAATLVGAGAGLVLTRTNKLRDNLPSLDDVGIGDLFDDLKSKVSSTVGTNSGSGGSTGNNRRTLSSDELEKHRSRRADARKQRARR